MKEQLIVYTNSYGKIIFDDEEQKPDPYYRLINEYLKNKWTVVSVTGTGVTGTSYIRGSFCMLLEKYNVDFTPYPNPDEAAGV